ncbi:hypothetical protein VQ02_32545 [Methylobacterium variabile]|uniref:Lysozyme inhibitor LprI N-terminal domain-containing protein n=1 Tax=Methylobacterium variabile TaxID=298794 RepID=A0A0J6S2D0_9HYPH|nr:hypothetical protein [Methylobacterium variabile]KMO27809.1 hypothetical protein VQ02_32545 [Methylobacterium variabile]
MQPVRLPPRPVALPVLAALPLAAVLMVAPAPASAQSFLEELFGIGRAARPPVPPAPVPGGRAPGVPGEAPPDAAPRPAPAPPAPPKPVVLKTPNDDAVVGQELQQNGNAGSLRLERSGSGFTARVTLAGTKVSQPTESCKIALGDGQPLTLSDQGKPSGVTQLATAGPSCPLRLEILEGSVMVTPLAEAESCVFTAADCATTPKGLWGPGAATLLPRAQEFDGARGVADKAVRENYKVMTQRARREDVRPIVAEQAAFSADREQMCRAYVREGSHGFCHLRFSEARALSLATRLGLSGAAPTASAAPRPARKRPAPAVDGMNPGFEAGAQDQ